MLTEDEGNYRIVSLSHAETRLNGAARRDVYGREYIANATLFD